MDLRKIHAEIGNPAHLAIDRMRAELQNQVRMAAGLQNAGVGREVARLMREASGASFSVADCLGVNVQESMQAARMAVEGRLGLESICDQIRDSVGSNFRGRHAFLTAKEMAQLLDLNVGRLASAHLGECALPFPRTSDVVICSERSCDEKLEHGAQNQAVIVPDSELLIPSTTGSFAVVPIYMSASKLLSIFKSPEAMRDLNPREFEEFCADLLIGNGWREVELTPRSKDGGKDIVAALRTKGFSQRYYFECKKYAPNRKIGEEIFNALLGVISRRSDRITAGAIMTTSEFTSPARKMIDSDVRLSGFDYFELTKMIKNWRSSFGAQAG